MVDSHLISITQNELLIYRHTHTPHMIFHGTWLVTFLRIFGFLHFFYLTLPCSCNKFRTMAHNHICVNNYIDMINLKINTPLEFNLILKRYCNFSFIYTGSIGGTLVNTNSDLVKAAEEPGKVQKNTERHTAHTIVSWPNPKQWVIVHTSDSMMIIRESIYILSIITREMGQLKTHSPTCFVMDNWKNMPYLTHTLDKLYLTGIQFNVFR